MIARMAPVLIAALVAVTLTGCVPVREVPRGPSDDDIAADLQLQVDLAWANTGLEGTVTQPEIAIGREPGTMQGLSECLADRGIGDWELSMGPGGASFGGSEVGRQLSFYLCFAQNPLPSEESNFGLTLEQREFLYDYYQRTVIPCLFANGLAVSNAPTRDQFLSPDWIRWNPYSSVGEIRTEDGFARAVDLCGEPYAGIDVEVAQWWAR